MKVEGDLNLEGDGGFDTGLFTDQTADGGSAMMPGSDYDGADATGGAPAPEQVETKAGKKLFRVDIGNGHVLVGETKDELLEKAIKSRIDTGNALLDRENQIRALKAAQQQPVPQQQPNTRAAAAPVPDGEYDDQVYLDLLGKDTIAARRYQDKALYGIDPVETLQKTSRIAADMQQRITAATFHQENADFPSTPENSAKIVALLESRGMPATVENLEWAFFKLQKAGQITAAPVQEEGVTYEDLTFGEPAPGTVQHVAPPAKPNVPQRQSRGSGAPAAIRGKGGEAPQDAIDVETMPLEDLKTYLRKNGVLGF